MTAYDAPQLSPEDLGSWSKHMFYRADMDVGLRDLRQQASELVRRAESIGGRSCSECCDARRAAIRSSGRQRPGGAGGKFADWLS